MYMFAHVYVYMCILHIGYLGIRQGSFIWYFNFLSGGRTIIKHNPTIVTKFGVQWSRIKAIQNNSLRFFKSSFDRAT